MATRRVAIVDPSGRHAHELSRSAQAAGLASRAVRPPIEENSLADADIVLVAAGAAHGLPAIDGGGPRWVFGDPADAGKLAGAAVGCAAAGVIVLPAPPAALAALVAPDVATEDTEQARLRSLLAASMLDDDPTAGLAAITAAFTADDCVVWWREGNTMTPRAARDAPDDGYRQQVSTAARVAAATGGTSIVGAPSGDGARSVIAAALRTSQTEVAGMVAVVVDHARRFSPAERSDLRALATRLTRELSHLSTHRRLVAEDEKLRAGSTQDSLTSALTRAAFEQSVANEVAAASRRGEPLCVMFIDIVGLRRINLQHGHRAGDEVLSQIANRVRAQVRGTDLLGRFGGDELSLLLINAPPDQARIVADKVLQRITGTPINFEGAEISVAIRGVVAPIAPTERSGEAAFARGLGMLRGTRPNAIAMVPVDTRPPEGDMPLDNAAFGVGTTLGGTYRILHELSRGAMGVVYRGEDIGLGRPVAIKVLRSDLAQDAELVTRFRAEAAMLASLHHPNLVQVYALGEHAGDVYFVMEMVEGQPISEVLRSAIEHGEWLPVQAIGQIAVEVADALDTMHQVGVIHRDVKPGNVLLDRERGRAVLVDVGVATKAGARGEGAGTPGFAAPESFTEGGESTSTDVYGLAATVYCMLTGHTPFGSGQVMQVVTRQLNDPLQPPSHDRQTLSAAVDEVMKKALDPVPKRRYASASAFALALARALERVRDAPATTMPPVDGDGAKPVPSIATVRPPVPPAEAAVALVTEVLPAGMAAVDPLPAPSTPAPASPTAGVVQELAGDIRGAHFRVAARGLSARVGAPALRNLVESSPLLARVLSPALPALGWEPIAAFLELLDRSAKHISPEELAKMTGRATIHATFARFFGANPASLPVETVMRAAPAFWGRYHTWSRLSLALSAQRHTEVLLQQPVSIPALCAMVKAQLARVAELAGGKDVECEHGMCLGRGHAECRFVVTWS